MIVTTLAVEVISIGRDVPQGSGDIHFHSKFTNAVNLELENGNKFISIVSKKVGAGPNNIVLNTDDVSFISTATWNSESLYINKYPLSMDYTKRYDDTIYENNIEISSFLSGLNLFERLLITESSPLSSAFLLDNRREAFFITPFEKKLQSAIRKYVESFLIGNLSALNDLKGLGFGLTPQGDDLIDGFVVALNVYQILTKKDTFKLRKKILKISETRNTISNTFLKYAVYGKLYERVKNTVNAIIYNKKNDIFETTKKLLQIGETSGSDIGTGFVLMSRVLVKGGTEWL